ncbi:MAG: ABC transporter ATP-binding protein, partial [Clostridiales bacterium]|nr:ABC transporter ATP-binding protein [Clostridiales bacterium]
LRELGKSVLISSHILPELSEMCDALTIIDRGKLVFTGSVEALSIKMQMGAPLLIRLARDAPAEAIDDAVSALAQFPGVTGIDAMEDNVLRVEVPHDDTAVCALNRLLVERGLPVADLHRDRMNLEHVFLEVTQG